MILKAVLKNDKLTKPMSICSGENYKFSGCFRVAARFSLLKTSHFISGLGIPENGG
jgi:hypothetical protein